MLLHFRLVEPIGQGGMGVVWKALDTTLDRHVALKTLPAEVGQDPDRLAGLEREAKFLAALNHSNIATIHGIHESEGLRFLTMEFVAGEDLSVRLAREPLPLEFAVRIAIEIAAAVEAAHARGILHRDLKPGNIRITSQGRAKVLDFGIAKALLPVDGDAVTALSAASMESAASLLIGTPAYMSPEQTRGEAVDRRSDVWALGCVVYEVLAGQPAFNGRTVSETVASVITEEPDWRALPEATPPSVRALLRRCLAKDARRRLSEVGTVRRVLVDALGAVAGGEAARVTSAVAVLPFVNMSDDADNQYFCDGLCEELISALTRLPGLKVASRSSSFRWRGSDQDVQRIGDELGVGSIVTGSVRRAGQRLRVAVQLIDVTDGYQRWSERYDRQMVDVFDIQDDIVSSVVAELVPALHGRHAVRRATDNLQAYEIYLKGRHFLNQRSPSTLHVAIQSFEQAIALDPDYVLAFTGVADCYTLLAGYGYVSPQEFGPRARSAIERAMALDPTLPELHFSRGFSAMYLERHWRSAEQHFRNAVAANERSSLFRVYLGIFLAADGRKEEAAVHIEHATLLDPLSPVVHGLAAIGWYVADQLELAADAARRALDVQPGYFLGLWILAVTEYGLGNVAAGVSHAEQAVMLSRAPFFIGVLGLGYGLAGRADDAVRLLTELVERERLGEYVSPVAPLAIHTGLRDFAAVPPDLQALDDAGCGAPTILYCCARHLRAASRDHPEIARLFDLLMGSGTA